MTSFDSGCEDDYSSSIESVEYGKSTEYSKSPWEFMRNRHRSSSHIIRRPTAPTKRLKRIHDKREIARIRRFEYDAKFTNSREDQRLSMHNVSASNGGVEPDSLMFIMDNDFLQRSFSAPNLSYLDESAVPSGCSVCADFLYETTRSRLRNCQCCSACTRCQREYLLSTIRRRDLFRLRCAVCRQPVNVRDFQSYVDDEVCTEVMNELLEKWTSRVRSRQGSCDWDFAQSNHDMLTVLLLPTRDVVCAFCFRSPSSCVCGDEDAAFLFSSMFRDADSRGEFYSFAASQRERLRGLSRDSSLHETLKDLICGNVSVGQCPECGCILSRDDGCDRVECPQCSAMFSIV